MASIRRATLSSDNSYCFYAEFLSPRESLLKICFIFTSAGVKCCVVAVKCISILHHSTDYIHVLILLGQVAHYILIQFESKVEYC